MAEVPLSALDQRQRKLVENARTALERGELPYALAALHEVLELEPACLLARQLQRVARLRHWRTQWRPAGILLGRWRWLVSGRGAPDRRPAEALRVAEHVLAADPMHVPALILLAESAQALGLLQTAVFARDIVRELAPGEHANLIALGRAQLAVGNAAAALRLADDVLAQNPSDAAAQDLMRSASIAARRATAPAVEVDRA